jgi:hypothetical protein
MLICPRTVGPTQSIKVTAPSVALHNSMDPGFFPDVGPVSLYFNFCFLHFFAFGYEIAADYIQGRND